MEFRRVVKEICASKGLTQKELAEKLGITDIGLNKMLRGQYPQLQSLERVADALDVPISQLFDNQISNTQSGDYKLVPKVNLDVTGGFGTGENQEKEHTVELVPFVDARDGDFCVMVTGDSMYPICPSGSLVLIREVERWQEFFGFGNIFCIVLKDGRRILKEAQKSNNKDNITCISYNSIPSEELPKNLILKVYKVIKILTDKGY